MKRNLDLVILVGGLITLGIISDKLNKTNYNQQRVIPSVEKFVDSTNRYLSNIRSNNYNGN